MKLALPLLLTLLWSVAVRAESPDSIPDPRRTNRSSIYDGAQVLSQSDEQRIDGRVSQLERGNDAQITIVTVQTVDDIPIEEFANSVARRLGLGQKGRDDGALFLFAIKDRKSWIEVGPGLQDRLTDARVAAITREQIRPAFREGNYGGGILAGVEVAANYLEGGSRPAPTSSSSQPQTAPPARVPSNGELFPPNNIPFPPNGVYPPSPSPSFPGELLLIALVVGGGVALVAYAGSRPRKCSRCQADMKEASPERVQSALNDAQNFEQHIGSRTFLGWECPKCQNFELGGRDASFSQWSRCEACHNRTAQVSSEVLQYPSYAFAGLERITEQCHYPQCHHVARRQRTIPRHQRSGSVIILGGGGFGGGYSGGGGWSGGSGSGDSGGSYDGGLSSSSGGGDFDGGGGGSDW